MSKPWFLYMIECIDGSIYTGIAVDVEGRYAAHCQGTGARYTRSHAPYRLLGYEIHPDRSSASKAEHRIKQLTASKKRLYANTLRPIATLLEVPAKDSNCHREGLTNN